MLNSYKRIVLYWCFIAGIAILMFGPNFINPARHVYQPTDSNNMTFLIEDQPNTNFYMSCSACVAVSVPLYLDFILDIFSGHKAMDAWERLGIAFSISIPKLFFILYPNNESKLFQGLCLQTTFDTVKLFMNVTVATKLNPQTIGIRRMGFICATYILAVALQHYNSLIRNVGTPVTVSDPFWYFTVFIYFLQAIYFINQHNQSTKGNAFISTHDKNKYYISLSHLMMPACLGVAVSILQIQYYSNTWLQKNENFFAVFFLIDTFITTIMTILPGRLARNEAIETNHILDTKRAFVRYVSHEIRSPLNVVVAGLNIIQRLMTKYNKLPTGTANENTGNILTEIQRMMDEFQCNLQDIHTASLSAIEILNDLLNYEKMDAGMFEVNMKLTPSQEMLESNLSSFITFAQSKEIEVKILDDKHLLVSTNRLSLRTDTSASSDRTRDFHLPSVNEATHHYLLNVDPHCIDIVMRNLMTNAVKFTPAGGTITIKVYIAHGDLSDINPLKEHLCVEVTDTGAGIDECNLGHLFGEFEQFDNRKLQGGGGSGLGLWICRNIINQHGGKIGAMSGGSGQGSTFYFQLPIVKKVPINKDEASEVAIEIANDSLPLGSESFSYIELKNLDEPTVETGSLLSYWNCIQRICFMVVDDSKINRKILIRLLQSEIAAKSPDIILDFIEAEDGDVAIEKLRSSMAVNVSGSDAVSRGSVDCILIDNIMVNMNGPEAVKAIREKLNYSGLIIGITGNALREDLEYFESCGCNKALSKPVDINLLLRLLEGGEVGIEVTHDTIELCDDKV